MVEIDKELLRDMLSRYQGRGSDLIPLLLEVQAQFSYLPEEAIQLIADFLDMPEGEIYSVSSFYSQFRLTPVGRQLVAVCRGTACHVRGASRILGEISEEIGVAEGETSDDMEYTLESVACIGCCALAPCIKVNNDVHGEMTAQKVEELFAAPVN
ncbi:MAG TPA: NADH-quinone oxidoreductase subunit NuoE [Dehalococcoidia bacterium]|nr:NADH-quinone oxidoreductase subunit NuoE [Dehalococcoidia bacterium]